MISGREAARLLGISDGRWRQIVGSGEPLLGEPEKIPGRRGGRWRLRDVLAYAMASGRGCTQPIPGLLPHPARPRYTSIEGRVHGARAGWAVTDEEGVEYEVWTQVFVPESWHRWGHDEPVLMLVTPLWGTTYVTEGDLVDIVSQTRTHPDLSGILPRPGYPNGTSLVVVVVDQPAHDGVSSEGGVPSLRSWRIPAEQLRDENRGQWFAASYDVPVTDVAGCLGWPGLPLWPYGTNTRAHLAAWRSGSTIEISVPEQHAPQHAAARWLEHAATTNSERTADYLIAAHALVAHAPTPRVEPIAGWQRAATVTPARASRPDVDGDLYAAVGDVARDPAVPAHVGDTVLDYFGDPIFSRPIHVRLDRLPQSWVTQITETVTSEPRVSPPETLAARWRRILAAASGDEAASDASTYAMGVERTPVVLSSTHLTWCSPHVEEFGDADRAGIEEILLARDSTNGRLGAWARPVAGSHFYPMPLYAGPGLSFNETAAVRAAVLGQPMSVTAEDRYGTDPLGTFLRSSQDDEATVVSWSTLCDIACSQPTQDADQCERAEHA